MAKALDGTALYTYFRRLGFPRETQELLMHIRSSPPSRTPGARRGNMPVWYPSKKMQCIIKAESTKVEFPFLLQAEHDDDVLEMWDQPHWAEHGGKRLRVLISPDCEKVVNSTEIVCLHIFLHLLIELLGFLLGGGLHLHEIRLEELMNDQHVLNVTLVRFCAC